MKKIYFGAIATIGFLFVSLHAANNDSNDPFVGDGSLQKWPAIFQALFQHTAPPSRPKKREFKKERKGGGKRKKTYSLEHKKHQGSEFMPEKELEKLRKSLAVSAEKQEKDKLYPLTDEQTVWVLAILKHKEIPSEIVLYSFVKNGRIHSLLP